MASLGIALIEARIAANFTQRQLAEQLNLSEQQIQRWENTQYESATLRNLGSVARVLGVRMGHARYKRRQKTG